MALFGIGSCDGRTSTAIATAATNPSTPLSVKPPAWMPEQGSVQPLTTANTFLSQNGRVRGWENAFGTIVDDYSGGVFNPFWGPLGAMVFHGGGHAATYDNSVVILDLNDLQFKRLSDPTPGDDGRNWTHANPDPAYGALHGEYGNGQPAAGHTYDTLAILPPADGGARCGSLVRVASFALHVVLSRNTAWSHRFDFDTTSMRQGRWQRGSTNGLSALQPGGCSAYDTRRKRFWWTASLSSLPAFVRYLDASSLLHVQVGFRDMTTTAPPAAPDSATMRYDPVRDLLLMTATVGPALRCAYLACSQPEQGWRDARLSHAIPTRAGWTHPFDHVPQADKFVMLAPADTGAVYDITIPKDPSQTWAVQRQPLAGSPLQPAYVAGKRWSYVPAARSFVWMAASTAQVVAYRPTGV